MPVEMKHSGVKKRVKKRVKKQFTDSSLGVDYISNLPQHIKDNILARLTTEEAVRTCVLSKEWKYAWRTVPKLVIFEKHAHDCSEYVDLLLSNHKGTINEFCLFMDCPDSEDLDRWISVLGSKGLKDLSLHICCELPPSFFSCLLDLTNLELSVSHLDIPELYRGFKLLRKIELDGGDFTKDDLEKLVSRCPLLEDLKIVDDFECLGNIVICSQSLENLTIYADFKHLLLETPKLVSFCTSPEQFDHKDEKLKRVEGAYQASFNEFDQEPKIWCNFLVVREISTVPRKLPIQLNHLIKMVIDIHLSDEGDHVAALCLFKSAPTLQDLHVTLHIEEGLFSNGFWESETGDDLFSRLTTITVDSVGLGVTALILEFVEFVLRTAPVLEKMNIRDMGFLSLMGAIKYPHLLEEVSQEERMMRDMRLDMLAIFEVLGFPRLSNKATVEFCESCVCTIDYGDQNFS